MNALLRKLSLSAFAASTWLCMAATAMAEDTASGGSSGGPAYVPSYSWVGLFIVIGLMTVIMPSRRREKAKTE